MNRISEIRKEIQYLKKNLNSMDSTMRLRMQEEIQNLEFDLDYLQRHSASPYTQVQLAAVVR